MKSHCRQPNSPGTRALIRYFLLSSAFLLTATCAAADAKWWKGNLHTHSHWSDGDDYPEMIVDWYKSNGYHFLALSDHNVMNAGIRWIDVAKSKGGEEAFEKYREKFGGEWVETRMIDESLQVRLKPLTEYRTWFEEPQTFLLITGEEISDRHLTFPIHLNASNLERVIPPQGGESVTEVIQNNVAAVLRQREETGRAMMVHLNHPNFQWGITAEEIIPVEGEKFFEVYNGHPAVRNEGDEHHASTERIWDIILTWRLGILNTGVIYGIATDDSHSYHKFGTNQSNTGRGWVMVRSEFLTPEHLIESLEAGDFYASSGVEIESIDRQADRLTIHVAAEPGVRYRTEFIGTRKGFNPKHEPILNAAGQPLHMTHRYSEEVGQVLKTVEGTRPSYAFQGDEIYVRATVTSSNLQENPEREGAFEKAWLQPAQP